MIGILLGSLFRLSGKAIAGQNTVTFGHTKSKESPYGSFSDYTRMQPYETPLRRRWNIEAKNALFNIIKFTYFK